MPEVNHWKRKVVDSLSFKTSKRQLDTDLVILLYVTLFSRGLDHGIPEVLSNKSVILHSALSLC